MARQNKELKLNMPFPHIMAPSMERLYDLMVNKAEKSLTEQEANQILMKLWLTHEMNLHTEWISLMTDINIFQCILHRRISWGVMILAGAAAERNINIVMGKSVFDIEIPGAGE